MRISLGIFTLKKNFMAPFYRLDSTASRLEPNLLFTTKFPEIPFYPPQKNERLSRSWSYPVVLKTGSLDWESSALTTRSLVSGQITTTTMDIIL